MEKTVVISICILTKDAASSLKETLDSTFSFPEVIVLDNGSADETLALAKTYSNVRIFSSDFIGFGPLKNKAAGLASNDWILSLDSDEVLSPPLIRELQLLQLNPQMVYSFPRHNYYNGRQILGCGWGNQRVARLYHRKSSCFSETQVHEKLVANHCICLNSPILHTPYRFTSDFLAKMQHYSTLFAEENQGKKHSSFATALAHGLYAFFRSYILKKGILCGREGFLISLYNANTTFYKYLKLAEKSDFQR